MSDSGRQIDDCRHGNTKGWCLQCLCEEVAGLREENRRLKEEMPCGHPRAYLRPLEGTAHGYLLFVRDPEGYGFCRACWDVRQEREACAREVEEFRAEGPPGTFVSWGQGLAKAIRKRGGN